MLFCDLYLELAWLIIRGYFVDATGFLRFGGSAYFVYNTQGNKRPRLDRKTDLKCAPQDRVTLTSSAFLKHADMLAASLGCRFSADIFFYTKLQRVKTQDWKTHSDCPREDHLTLLFSAVYTSRDMWAASPDGFRFYVFCLVFVFRQRNNLGRIRKRIVISYSRSPYSNMFCSLTLRQWFSDIPDSCVSAECPSSILTRQNTTPTGARNVFRDVSPRSPNPVF